jgi:hypothetical protein
MYLWRFCVTASGLDEILWQRAQPLNVPNRDRTPLMRFVGQQLQVLQLIEPLSHLGWGRSRYLSQLLATQAHNPFGAVFRNESQNPRQPYGTCGAARSSIKVHRSSI